MTGDRNIWGEPRRPGGPNDGADGGLWMRGPGAGEGQPDVAVLAETDALLDRLAARRPTAEDLDDPAAGILALLAAEVDLNPVSHDGLRRELFERGVWPPVPSAGFTGADAPPPALPPTEVLDLRSVGAGHAGAGPDGGPAWSDRGYVPAPQVFPQGNVHALADAPVRAPRQVRVRLLAVAACTVLGLWGVAGIATGAWNPWHQGTIIAGTDDHTQIETLLTDGLGLVSSNTPSAEDKLQAKAKLQKAYERAKRANLSPQDRKEIDRLLNLLSQALTDKGVVLPPELAPGTISTQDPSASDPSSGDSSPSSVPSVDPTDAPTSPGNSGGVPTKPDETTTSSSTSSPDDPDPSTPPGNSNTGTTPSTTPAASRTGNGNGNGKGTGSPAHTKSPKSKASGQG